MRFMYESDVTSIPANRQMPLAMSQFRAAEPGETRKSYYEYAEAVLAEMVLDDLRDLAGFFGTGIDHKLTDAVVAMKLHD